MSVDISILIIIVLVLLIILPLLVLLYVIAASKGENVIIEESESEMSFEIFEQMLESPSTTRSGLNDGVNFIVKHHGVIGQGEFPRYETLVKKLCKHKNVDKTIVLKLDRALNKANPQHKKSLAKALKSALNARD